MDVVLDTKMNSQGSVTVTAVGEIDVSCADVLRDALDGLVADETTQDIAVDLSQVPYIDSTGIGVLVGSVQRAREAGKRLVVVGAQRNVRRVLDLLGLSRELGLGETGPEA